MELDELKIHWKKQSDPTTGSLNTKIIETMLNNTSKSPVSIMKRNLKKELWFVTIVFSVTASLFFIIFKGIMTAYGWMYIFFLLTFILYYYFKNRLLNNMQCNTCEVRSNLTLQLDSLENYVKKNLLFSTMIFPVFLMVNPLMMHLKGSTKIHTSVLYYTDSNPAWLTTLVWFGIAITLTIPLYYLNKKYLYKLYGKHIKRLRDIVGHMEPE